VTESSSFDLPADVAEPIVGRVMEKIRRERGKQD